MAIKVTDVEENTSGIKDKLYPKIAEAMDKSSVRAGYKRLINDFISNRSEDLYDSLPCSRIVCSEKDMDRLFDVLHIKKSEVMSVINDDTYFGKMDHFKPLAAKHEFTIAQICIIRYFLLNKMQKDAELAMIYLAFSGKFYPSLHYRQYKVITPVRHVMEYTVNNRLSKKFDLIVYGSVIGAIKSVSLTWADTYTDRFKSFSDFDVKYLIEQLYNRIGSFTKNIAEEYYDVYENKDLYIAYSYDSYDNDNFHMADSDTLKVTKYVERTANYINSNGVDYKVCNMCANADITPNECKAVIESIISSKENIYTIKELISIMIALYFSTGEKDISDIKFISYTIAPKPNAKQKEILRLKEIIETWLSESGTAYMRRKSRIATKNAYERCVRMYFALIIHNANR